MIKNNSKNKKWIGIWNIVIISIIVLFQLELLPALSQKNDHRPLEYEVQVDAQIIPIYAVDAKGEPVYNLKAEEIELFINHTPQKILYFMSYQVESKESTEDGAGIQKESDTADKQEQIPSQMSAQKEKKPVTIKSDSPERLNFIILDGISNSKSGVRNAKKLAEGLIKSGGPGDGFVILTSNIRNGLQYVAGPEKNKEKLLKILGKIYQDPRWIVMMPSKSFMSSENPEEGELMFWAILNPITVFEKGDVKNQYQSALARFTRSLEDLKKALKTIRLPKKIFLVSGGIQEIASFSESIVDMQGLQGKYEQSALLAYYGMLKKASIAINEGGSLLYMVNPIPEVNKVRSASKIMSDVSNAECISANNAADLLNQVKKSTSAYYEVAYSITPEMKENFKIDIKCKRKGVKLTTLQYGEKAKPYKDMDTGMKKLFALNVVTGGSWSRMVAKLALARFQKINDSGSGKSNKKENITKQISLRVPMEFKDKKIDIFIINIKPNSYKADIQLSQRLMMNPTEILQIEAQRKRDQFIVLVEPQKTLCLFNRVN